MPKVTGKIEKTGYYWWRVNGTRTAKPIYFESGDTVREGDECLGPIPNPFENTEPIDGEWLAERGGNEHDGKWWFARSSGHQSVYVHFEANEWVAYLYRPGALILSESHEFLLCLKTRYDLLNLLDALGARLPIFTRVGSEG